MMNAKPYFDDEIVLLGEFHHRLFNTIELVATFVSRCGESQYLLNAQPCFDDLGGRLHALAEMNRLLALPNQGRLLEDYCRSLCILLVRAFGREDIIPWVCMEDLSLSRDEEFRIALLVVELVMADLKTNAGLEGGGTIWVDLRTTCSSVELSVCDSRKGLARVHATPTIVGALARCLDGEPFVSDRGGSVRGVRFPLRRRAEEAVRPCVHDPMRRTLGA